MYEVQQNTFCDGWVNTWRVEDEHGNETPEYFSAKAEAQKEIDDFFEEINFQIEYGERDPDNGYDREEYRIVEVK